MIDRHHVPSPAAAKTGGEVRGCEKASRDSVDNAGEGDSIREGSPGSKSQITHQGAMRPVMPSLSASPRQNSRSLRPAVSMFSREREVCDQ